MRGCCNRHLHPYFWFHFVPSSPSSIYCTPFLGQWFLGCLTPTFFSYGFVSMSPNHLAPRMAALPFCLLSLPDPGSLSPCAGCRQEKGQGQGLGWGRGREWRRVECFLGYPRWHLHPTSSCPLKNKVSTLCLAARSERVSVPASLSL